MHVWSVWLWSDWIHVLFDWIQSCVPLVTDLIPSSPTYPLKYWISLHDKCTLRFGWLYSPHALQLYRDICINIWPCFERTHDRVCIDLIQSHFDTLIVCHLIHFKNWRLVIWYSYSESTLSSLRDHCRNYQSLIELNRAQLLVDA